MRLHCPHCGERDAREFEYLGSAKLLERPDAGQDAYYDYVYLRDNPAGENAELWQHVFGCRAWLHVRRNVSTHAVLDVKLAKDVKGGKL